MHQFRLGEGQRAVGIDQQVAVGRGNVDGGRAQVIAFFGLLDLQRRAPAEDFSHQAAVTRVEMLDDDNGGRKIGRQAADHLAQGRQSAGRSRQGHDVKSRTSEMR